MKYLKKNLLLTLCALSFVPQAFACRILPDPGFQSITAGSVGTITAWTRDCPADLTIWVAPSVPPTPTAPIPPFTDDWIVSSNPQCGNEGVTFQIQVPLYAQRGQRNLLLWAQSPSMPQGYAGSAVFTVNIQ